MKYLKLSFFLSIAFFIATFSLHSQSLDGYVLYNKVNENSTYLIDSEGDIAKIWNFNSACNYAVLLKENGNLVRGEQINTQINGAAVGGRVSEYDTEGNVVWSFDYATNDYVQHHDIDLGPNGSVFLISWQVKSAAEMAAVGLEDPEEKYVTGLIEIMGNDNGGADIIWEWHFYDHLIQDVDPSKPNYTDISTNPHRLDVNVDAEGFGGGPGGPPGFGNDWLHCNGIHYNAERDQVAFTSRFLSEIFVIDHSTTTEEAAGSTGGNSGMGGDLLYRWGNPANYKTTGPRLIAGPCHDARWVPNDGRPRGGFLQFFNNDGPDDNGSTIDVLDTPYDPASWTYTRNEGEPFGPTQATWTHIVNDYAGGQSSAMSLPNGNIFVNMSQEYMYEETENGTLVFQYPEGPAKAFRYTCDHPGIITLLDDPCQILGIKDAADKDIEIFPIPSTGMVNISGNDIQTIKSIAVTDVSGKLIYEVSNTHEINLTDTANGLYFVKLTFEDAAELIKKISILK